MSATGSDPKLTTGSPRCKCSACGEYFTGEASFARHRVGSHPKRERACLGVTQMREAGLELNPKGYWSQTMSEAARQRLVKLRQAA